MSLPFDTITQEYIEVIYDLERLNRVARVTDIANRRGVTKASVSLVLNQLQKKELIDRQQYGHITLTKAGKRLGAKLSQRHENIKKFLHLVVGIPEHIADKDACKLEHILSNESCAAMKEIVGAAQDDNADIDNLLARLKKKQSKTA